MINPTERSLGCGCFYLPAAFILFAMLGGSFLAEGPQPDGRIGWEPERPRMIGTVLVSLVGVAGAGAVWATGRPRSVGSAGPYGAGSLLMGAGALVAVNGVGQIPVAWCLLVLGAATTAWTIRREGATPSFPSGVDLPELRNRDFEGRLLTISGAALATVGMFATWPRDPTKTTAAPEVTGSLAIALLTWGFLVLSRSGVEKAGIIRLAAGWIFLGVGAIGWLTGLVMLLASTAAGSGLLWMLGSLVPLVASAALRVDGRRSQ